MAEGRAHKLCKEWLAEQMDGEVEVSVEPRFRGKRRVDVLGLWPDVQAIVQAVGEVDCVRRRGKRRCRVEVYKFKSGELLDEFACECAGCQ